MGVEDYQQDESLRRCAFPVTRSKIYFAHAAVGPLPTCVGRAMRRYLRRAERSGQFELLHREAEAGARAFAAELLDVTPEEVAFVPSTSTGISMIAAGLDWRPGDRVLISASDFPANIYPWLNLERLGVRVDRITPAPDGAICLDDLCRRVHDRTRLVALSSIHYATGAPLDVNAIGAFLRTRGILFCLDAIQSLGAVRCSARLADVVVADAHKWLLGPQGIGLLVIRREAIPQIRPVLVGWKSVAAPADFHLIRFELADSARQYEPGSLNAVGLVGLHAALALLHSVGIDAIASHLGYLRCRLIEGLRERGYTIVGPERPALPTGILAFRGPGDMEDLNRLLAAQGCLVSLRRDACGGAFLRAAPHFYNTTDEIARFLNLLPPATGPKHPA